MEGIRQYCERVDQFVKLVTDHVHFRIYLNYLLKLL